MPNRAPRRKELTKVCEKCCTLNTPRAAACKQCGSKRFAPTFVRQLRKVNRNVYVQVTQAPERAKTDTPRVTLYKWWPGGGKGRSFNIPTADQWETIKRIIDQDLAPHLRWQTRRQLTATIKRAQAQDRSTERDVKTLVQHDPAFLPRVLKGIKFDKATDDDVERIAAGFADLSQAYLGADDSLRRAMHRLIQQLPAQGRAAIDGLADLMQSLTLAQITAVTSEVQRRMGLLRTFKNRIEDDRTYEIRGANSIHRLLETAMWIVDERYWLMHSNSSLREVVGAKLAKDDKKLQKKRPDFVCGEVGDKLIIVEIKRPSHTLGVDDLNQLERYVITIQKHSTKYTSVEGILVGRLIHPDLTPVLRLRGRHFSVRTYTDLIGDAERRYKQYIDALTPA